MGKNDLTDNQARILNNMLKNDLLPNAKEKFPHCNELVNEYRKIEEKVTAPRLARRTRRRAIRPSSFERGKKPAHQAKKISKPLTTPLPKDNHREIGIRSGSSTQG